MGGHQRAAARELKEVSSPHPLRILSLEDDPHDAELIQELLEAGGIACQLFRVDSQSAFSASLEQGETDLILADYTLPAFDGLSALKQAMTMRPEVPFIFVTGTLGEEVAIEALKVGATDYVLKTRLSRLVPSVLRALREAKERAERKQAEKALRRSEAYLAEAQRLSRTGSFGWNVLTEEHSWSDETYRIYGYDRGITPTLVLVLQRIHPEDRERVREVILRASNGEPNFDIEHRLLMDDGSIKFVRVVAHLLAGDEPDGLLFVGAVTDITHAKRAEEALRRSEGYLAEAQRLTRTGSWAWNEVAGQSVHWSQEHFRMFGFDPKRAYRPTRPFTSGSMRTIGIGWCAPFTKRWFRNGLILTLSTASFFPVGRSDTSVP